MKLISWNINGIRAAWKKGFPEFVAAQEPDVLCVQETKIQHGPAHAGDDGSRRLPLVLEHGREEGL